MLSVECKFKGKKLLSVTNFISDILLCGQQKPLYTGQGWRWHQNANMMLFSISKQSNFLHEFMTISCLLKIFDIIIVSIVHIIISISETLCILMIVFVCHPSVIKCCSTCNIIQYNNNTNNKQFS